MICELGSGRGASPIVHVSASSTFTGFLPLDWKFTPELPPKAPKPVFRSGLRVPPIPIAAGSSEPAFWPADGGIAS